MSLLITQNQQKEEKKVDVLVNGSIAGYNFTPQGLAVRLALVNESLRPVAIGDASLWLDGRELAPNVGYLADPQALDQQREGRIDLNDRRRELPFTMEARGSQTIVLLVDAFRGRRGVEVPDAGAKRAAALGAALDELSDVQAKHVLEVKLELLPGGNTWYHLSVVPQSQTHGTWQIRPHADRRRLTSFALRRLGDPTAATAPVTLELWGGGRASRVQRVERPVIGEKPTIFPLTPLGAGTYLYVFELGRNVVDGGRVRVRPRARQPVCIEKPTSRVSCSPGSSVR